MLKTNIHIKRVSIFENKRFSEEIKYAIFTTFIAVWQ